MLKKRGAALLTVVIIMSAVFLLAIIILNGQIRSTKDLKYIKSDTQAYYCAESGVNYAMAQRIKDIKGKANSYNFTGTYTSSSNAITAINSAVSAFLTEVSKDSSIYNGNLFNDSNAGYEQASTKVNKVYTMLKSDGTAAIVPAVNGNYNFDINSSNGKIYVLYDVNSKGYYSYGDRIYYSLNGQFKICIQAIYNVSTAVGSDGKTTIVTANLAMSINDSDNDYKIYNKNTGTTN